MSKKIWLVTGVSSGFGKSLAAHIIAGGDVVIGTMRKAEQVDEFNTTYSGKALGIQMDVTDIAQVKAGVAKAIQEYGRIDILVNNAGYGLFGAVEEVNEQEARDQMETNFYGPLWLTQEVLPHMRSAGGGNIVQVSSVAGFRSTPGVGLYNASKFALEGFSEALSHEVAGFNIKVTIVEPGPYRTKWAGASAIRSAKVMDEYTNSIAGKMIKEINGYDGMQPGDPDKAADLIIKVIKSENPPLRLPLGQAAITRMRDKMQLLEKEIQQWEKESVATAF
ncbi:MAG: oxidoreductase [Bacteroidota bacterium]